MLHAGADLRRERHLRSSMDLARFCTFNAAHGFTTDGSPHPNISTPTMASLRVPSASFLAVFLPVARAELLPAATAPRRLPLLQRLQLSPLLPAALAPIPTLLGDLWDGLLKAVPKKKTSHMKKRHRQLASGKHLKDVTALNKCSACGRLKRAHILCPYCVQSELKAVGTQWDHDSAGKT